MFCETKPNKKPLNTAGNRELACLARFSKVGGSHHETGIQRPIEVVAFLFTRV